MEAGEGIGRDVCYAWDVSGDVGRVGGGRDVEGHLPGNEPKAGAMGLHFGDKGEGSNIVCANCKPNATPPPLGQPVTEGDEYGKCFKDLLIGRCGWIIDCQHGPVRSGQLIREVGSDHPTSLEHCTDAVGGGIGGDGDRGPFP